MLHAFTLLAAAGCVTACDTVPEVDFYVAPGGDDTSPGTLARPFATLGRARDALRSMLPDMDRDLVVMIRGGRYFVEETIAFMPEDSGRNGHCAIYGPYPGETPHWLDTRRRPGIQGAA